MCTKEEKRSLKLVSTSVAISINRKRLHTPGLALRGLQWPVLSLAAMPSLLKISQCTVIVADLVQWSINLRQISALAQVLNPDSFVGSPAWHPLDHWE